VRDSEGYGFPEQDPEDVEAQAKVREAHAARKDRPLFTGCISYFPDALAEVARLSKVASAQHGHGTVYWEFYKSSDHKDALLRHLVDAGTLDTDEIRHSVKVAWRALAALQTELETENSALHARRQADRDKAKIAK